MFLYIIKNNRGELYKGISKNIERRLQEHNKNYSPGTRGKGPWSLVYFEELNSVSSARRREKYFKSGEGRELLKRLLDVLPS